MERAPLQDKQITQVGLVVDDIERTAQAWADLLGVQKPEIMITDRVEIAHTEYKGQPTTARAMLAFFHVGPLILELIEPINENSTWKEHLDNHGPSLHHIAFDVEDINENLNKLSEYEMVLIQRGDFEGGSYAYVDGQQLFGTVIELLETD